MTEPSPRSTWDLIEDMTARARMLRQARSTQHSELLQAVSATFTGPSGQLTLGWLLMQTSATLDPGRADDRQLWFLEGQRALVERLMTIVETGA